MEVVGLICEYNPLHNGHLYHIKKIKELYPDSILILVMNGLFLQRGEVSIINKENKTKMALNSGVDIVLELPFVFGTQSADTFALYSLKILNELKVKHLVFGSECNNINKLNEIVDYIMDENNNYDELVKEYLNKGLNYPTALAKALNMNFAFLPNDLLGISYLKAIKKNNFDILAEVIKRTSDYSDTLSNESIVSAKNIRERLKKKQDISKYVPKEELEYLEYHDLNDYFPILKYKIITDPKLENYLDVDEGLHNRLKKVINDVNSTSELIMKVKSKRYTYNKITRMLTHILVGLTKEDTKKLNLDYIKVLGFNKLGSNYLRKIRKEMNISLSPDKNSLTYSYELKASLVFDLVSKNKSYPFEKINKPIIKK